MQLCSSINARLNCTLFRWIECDFAQKKIRCVLSAFECLLSCRCTFTFYSEWVVNFLCSQQHCKRTSNNGILYTNTAIHNLIYFKLVRQFTVTVSIWRLQHSYWNVCLVTVWHWSTHKHTSKHANAYVYRRERLCRRRSCCCFCLPNHLTEHTRFVCI